MPRYFFDIDDDQFSISDTVGLDCPSLEAASKEAVRVAACIAKDLFSSGAGTRITVRVRDIDQQVFEATLLLKVT
ncbi:DUF6894 family protein [Bradyrhizobium retamae]|uniref:DUF6894 domain-containing protein n=1 Tax=Bradyrhizobium retamae TaxID=1300035 RepID=A0A0R3N594_9BRAD|nr:hypothetical protein [Bradyrhizobium retamae]KRR27636.1 hypothetical protein CQ13_04435 [Bradyrhizobium retamae]